MAELTAFLQANIIPIYFIYGLAHFITGLAVALETGRTSQLQFSRAMPYLAAFALVHGTKEWSEMFSRIAAQVPTLAPEPEWAGLFKLGLNALSFFCLFQFAVRLIGELIPVHKRWLRWLPFLSLVIWLAGTAVMHTLHPEDPRELHLRIADVWARYSFGLPATIAATLALLVQRRIFIRENMPQFGRDLIGAALAFGWYAFLDNVVVPKTPYFPSSVINSEVFLSVVGVPVQLLRAIVLLIYAFFVIRTLRVFEVEYARRLETANRARFEAQEQANRELAVMFETCRSLGTTLELQRLLDDAIRQIVNTLDPMIAGMIYLYDPAAHRLTVRASHRRPGRVALSAAEMECAERTAARAFDLQTIGYLNEPRSGTSMLAVPLIVQEQQPVGALCLAHREAFSNYPVILTLARQLSIAVENAQLYTQVQEKEVLRGQLLERTVAAQEEERKRVARELHDETGQTLTALAVGLGAVEETLARNPNLAKQQLSELKTMTMNAIGNLRQFVSDLRPSVLDDMGLVSALRWFGEEYSGRMGIPVEIEIGGTKRRLPTRVETVLFRIAQESLTNIARHAHATRAALRLEFADASVVLSVSDNGCGFDVDQVMRGNAARRAWGLLGVQERVTLVGGKFKIDSAPGKGTRMVVEVPVAEEILNSNF